MVGLCTFEGPTISFAAELVRVVFGRSCRRVAACAIPVRGGPDFGFGLGACKVYDATIFVVGLNRNIFRSEVQYFFRPFRWCGR